MAWKPDYITLAQARQYLDVPADVTVNDDLLAVVISATSRAIDRHCNRQFGKVDDPVLRYCGPARWDRWCRWVLPIPDLMTDVGLTVLVGSTEASDVRLEPRDAAAEGRPWTRLVLPEGFPGSWPTPDREASVTAGWGWSAVPDGVALACRMQVNRFDFRRLSPAGVAGSPELGSEIRLLAKVDPDVAVLLTDFVRPRSPR